MKLTTYVTDLGFHSEDATLGPSNVLLVLGVYVALALGIFLREISAFPRVDLNLSNVRLSVVVASIALALALAPPLMRWISKKHQGRPTWEHVAWSVTYGFFSNLLMSKILAEVLK